MLAHPYYTNPFNSSAELDAYSPKLRYLGSSQHTSHLQLNAEFFETVWEEGVLIEELLLDYSVVKQL